MLILGGRPRMGCFLLDIRSLSNSDAMVQKVVGDTFVKRLNALEVRFFISVCLTQENKSNFFIYVRGLIFHFMPIISSAYYRSNSNRYNIISINLWRIWGG